ncbi:MAG TPA: ABC transporter ATP-binding protein [Candidatus Paceibacterota bacterium]|nr:ABC transporter ATP-binding protein [Candidatus Paceibacterota bacterium]
MKVQKEFLRRVWVIFGPLKWRMLIVLIGIALTQTLSLVGPYIQGTILDNISHGKAIGQTYWLIVLAGTVWLFRHWILEFSREMYEIQNIDFDIDERASDQTMAQLMNLSVGQHNTLHSGIKQSIVNRGQNSMTALVNMFIYEVVPTISRAFIMVIAMCWLSMAMGLIVFSAVVVFVILTLRMNYLFRSDLKKLEKMWNQESKFRSEIIQHVGYVLVNAQEHKARAEADAKYEETVAFAKPLWRRFLAMAYLKSTVIIVARVAIMVLGVRYIYSGRYTFGSIVVFWSWSNNALDSVSNVGNLQRQIMKMWTSIKRYCEFLGMESDVTVVLNPVVLNPVQGRIEVRNLSFTYDSRMAISEAAADDDDDEDKLKEIEKSKRPALQDVSFVIEPGETVAIVGESGSGKTTLANMLVRASDPTAGQILIDGQDLRVLDLSKFRTKVGVVEQNVPLFDRSIRENILYGLNGKAKDVTEEELQRIAQISQISRFSHKLEKGFDTLIGERGLKLSGGERQRIGIARALIKDPAIIIFDEATSSLDAAVEAEIREAINEASKGRTTILIAHRFSTIRYANRVLVMDEGQLVGEGKHADLYESCPQYRRLVDLQVFAQKPLLE